MSCPVSTTKRIKLRIELDATPDFVSANGVVFKQHFVTVRFDESYNDASDETVASVRRLLELPVYDTLASMMRTHVTFNVGSNRVPLFGLRSGGNDRTLFSFGCVFKHCPAFADVRLFRGVERIKWIVLGITHTHDFAVFPARVPRSTVPDELKVELQRMVLDRRS